jgi:hypothetical protein
LKDQAHASSKDIIIEEIPFEDFSQNENFNKDFEIQPEKSNFNLEENRAKHGN